MDPDSQSQKTEWPLLPSERALWEGGPADVARSRVWSVASLLFLALSIVSACFAALLATSEMAGAHQSIGLAGLFLASSIGAFVWPRHRLENVAYLVTDQRVLRRSGRSQRFIDRSAITYARIHWHRASPVVGHLELVVATPFGPLRRQLRVVLEDVREPDRLWALIRGREASEGAGDSHQPFVERLDLDERIVWSGRPLGSHIGWREAAVAASGVAITTLSFFYAHRNISILLDLEGLGLQVRSASWGLLFSAVLISWVSILAVGLSLLHHGFIRSRKLGQDTEYVLTDSRLLIRRGHTELSLGRSHIVDIAEQPAARGLVHLFLVLDGPGARALADNGAMNPIAPARDAVPPVLFDLRASGPVREALLGGA